MAETDFAFFGVDAASIKRGATAGTTKPNGGGSFVFGFNSVTTGVQAVGTYYNKTNFAPLRDSNGNVTGGSIRGAIMKGRSSNALGFSIGLFMNLQSTAVGSTGYFLGLSKNDPSYIVLAKTSLTSGIDSDAASTMALRVSTASVLVDVWKHLRLDAIVNPNGDVVLKCFANDLDTNPVSSPIWAAIAGMDDYIDDALGVATGSSPLGGGYTGFGFHSEYAESRGYVDYLEISRQL